MSKMPSRQFYPSKTCIIIICSIILAFLLVTAKFISFQTKTSVLTLEELKATPYYSEFQAKIGALADPNISPQYKPYFGHVYLVEFTNLLSEKTMVLSAPYSFNFIGDTMLGGTTHWGLGLELLTLRWHGDSFIMSSAPLTKDLALRVEADKNTYLNLTGNTASYDNTELAQKYKQAPGSYWVNVSAATLDSSWEANAQCTLKIGWCGTLLIKANPFMSHSFEFDLSTNVPYRNNARE